MNDLFCCETCNHVDALEFAYPNGASAGPMECTKCQTGQWHGLMTYREFNPASDLVANRASGVGLS